MNPPTESRANRNWFQMLLQKLRRRWGRILLILFGLALIVYVVSYLPRRAYGSYRLTQSGEARWNLGLAATDLVPWSPEECWWQPSFRDAGGKMTSRGDRLGYFCAPLIALDRRFNYPNRILFTAEDLVPPSPQAPDSPEEPGPGDQGAKEP